jgi:predicted AAA+ superfamily ATPase
MPFRVITAKPFGLMDLDFGISPLSQNLIPESLSHFQILAMADIYAVNRIPLLLNEKSSLFKLFLSDVGMLTTFYGKTAKLQLLSDQTDINCGAIYENVVAQELKAHGFSLYYYNSKRFGELDFVIEHEGRILPIEVKSGKSYQRHSALNNVMEISNYAISEAFVLSGYNVEVKGNLVYYPIYMMMFIENDAVQLPALDLFDLSSLPLSDLS